MHSYNLMQRELSEQCEIKQVQNMETFSRSEDPAEREQTLNLITHVAVQPACESDAHALVPAIADTQVRGLGPDELLADTLYGLRAAAGRKRGLRHARVSYSGFCAPDVAPVQIG